MRGVKSLTPLAISLVILVMVIATGGIMLSQFQPASYVNNQVTGEAEASTGAVPETITTDNMAQGVEDETITLYDNETETNYTLQKTEDYEVISYDNGEFNVTNADVDGDGTNEVSNTDDTYYLDYTYNTKGTASGIIDQGLSALDTFGSFFTVIVVVGIGAVLLLLLQVFRTAGRSTSQTMA